MPNENTVTLREYFHGILNERDKRIAASFISQQVAVDKAEIAVDKRLSLLNEFRQQSLDESKKYALKETVTILETQHARLYGGMLVIGAIGIANLVRMFYGH